MKLPLSLVIIASNEEKNIARCLRSAADLVSEIILVENDTTDDTCSSAASFGAKIFHESWHGFAEQKNLAVQYASQEWILSLDADEELDDQLKHSILQFIASDDQRYHGCSFSRRTFFMNRWIKHGDWAPDNVTRLFRKGYGRWSGDNVHERLIIDGKVKHLSGHLLHYSYASVREYMYKNLKYAELGAHMHKHSKLNILLRSFWKFFRGYFLKLGFLDGFPGLYIAIMQSCFTLYKYTVRESSDTKLDATMAGNAG